MRCHTILCITLVSTNAFWQTLEVCARVLIFLLKKNPQPLRLLHPDRVPHRLLKAYTSEPLRLLYPDRVPHSPLKAHISQPLRLLHPDRVSEAFCTPRCQVALKSQHQSRPPGLSPGDHTADLQSPKRPKSDLPKPQDVEIGRLLSCDPLKVTITETATHISINK